MSSELTKNSDTVKNVENLEIMPPVDIFEDPEEFIMHFEVPGVNSASVKIPCLVTNSIFLGFK